ncbi:MAG: TPM domain-containing protein [Pseudorhodobacter sp.]
MIRLLALILFLPVAALAQTYPAPLSDTVSDYADLLPPEAEDRVAALLQAARDETGVHIALATIESQADYDSTARFADFATGWFNAWGIGDAARNDGILILVARTDREMRIVLGDGYDVIWDGRAQRVIDTAMLPAFRNDDYAAGLEAGAQSAIDRLARPFAAREEVTETSGFPEESSNWTEALPFSLFALFAAFIVFGRKIKAAVSAIALRFRRCPACGHRGLQEHRETLTEPGESSEGHGIRHRICNSCRADRPMRYTIPSLASQRAAKKSSSSGFGGGRSSGGGASGRW